MRRPHLAAFAPAFPAPPFQRPQLTMMRSRPARGAPAAARGAPARDVHVHHLFVMVGGTRASTAATMKLLQFMAHCKPWLARMKIDFKIDKVRPELLAKSPKLQEAFRAKGITAFPALRTPRGTVRIGVQPIAKTYSQVIDDFKRALQSDEEASGRTGVALDRQGIELGDASYDDIYRTYFADDLTFGAAESERGEEDEGMGDTGSMMASYQSMLRRRQNMTESRKKRGNAYVDSKGRRKRQDARTTAPDGDIADVESEAAIDRLISTVVAPVDDATLRKAFGEGGGAEDAREDVMLNAFWENQSTSI